MLHFFKVKSQRTLEDAQELLSAAFQKLNAYNDAQTVIKQLRARQLLIEQQIAQAANKSTKEKLIGSYYLFAETLTHCVDKPAQHLNWIKNYHNSSDYYHIDGSTGQYSYTFMDNVMTRLSQISTTMLVCSFIALPFELTASLILLGAAIFILAPALFYIIAETNANRLEVRKEERALFAAIQTLVASDVDNAFATEHPIEMSLTGS